jgi:hypothetical protein
VIHIVWPLGPRMKDTHKLHIYYSLGCTAVSPKDPSGSFSEDMFFPGDCFTSKCFSQAACSSAFESTLLANLIHDVTHHYKLQLQYTCLLPPVPSSAPLASVEEPSA